MNIGSNPFGNLSSGIGSKLDTGGGLDGGGDNAGIGSALQPNRQATGSEGSSFSDTLRDMVISRPSEAQNTADSLGARFAAGDKSIDPQDLAIATAKAGVEIQMSTRTISQAAQAIRTLMQMQI